MLTALSKSIRWQLPKVLLILVLVGLVGFGALPGYVAGGKWRWTAPPHVTMLKELQALRQTGLTVPGWQTVNRQIQEIGEHQWVQQDLIDANQTRSTLLLFPQKGSTKQPQVEWTDIDGFKGWKTDSHRTIELTASSRARFFRGWTSTQTHAVLQWYAWTGGGHPAPSHWFFVDRVLQWQNRRAAWVAVSLLLPIEPLDDIEKYRSTIEPLAQAVQSALTTKVLRPDS
jgi:cyanoexosortase B-associated protein